MTDKLVVIYDNMNTYFYYSQNRIALKREAVDVLRLIGITSFYRRRKWTTFNNLYTTNTLIHETRK